MRQRFFKTVQRTKTANQKIEEGLIENKNVTPREQTEERTKIIRGQIPVGTMQNPKQRTIKKTIESHKKHEEVSERSRLLLAKIEGLAMTS